MQKISLANHFTLPDVERAKDTWRLVPESIKAHHADRMQVWALLDPAMYRYRGLIDKITARRLTKDIDWKILMGHFSYMAGGPERADIVFVLP